MLLIFTQKATPRLTYVFKHVFTRILGIEIDFTSTIEVFVAHSGAKMSYGKQPMGNELFFQSEGLLVQQGIESVDVTVKVWEDTSCFFTVSSRSALPYDIFAASFYLLSRYEEYLPHVKDELSRYPASESIGHKHAFLHQPVIDLWAFKLKEVLQQAFPFMVFPEKKLEIHSVIEASQPYAFSQKGLFRNVLGYVSELVNFRIRSVLKRSKVIFRLQKDPYNTFNWIIAATKASASKVTIFFMLGDALVFSEGLSQHRKKFRSLMKYVSDYKELGLLFSPNALHEYETLKTEKKQLEEITNRTLLSTMNDQFLVHLPDVPRHLVELEVQRDFTMVYQNAIGFRAGTCTPFLFYDLDFEIKTPLEIHPIAAATKAMNNMEETAIEEAVNLLYNEVSKVKGTFTMHFSNRDFADGPQGRMWRRIFSEKLHKNES
jgi:hypothetical protein